MNFSLSSLFPYCNITIIAVMLVFCFVLLRRNKGNPVALGRKARYLPIAGLGLIALYYAIDLSNRMILPLVWADRQSISFLTDLYASWSWPLILLAVLLIATGYLLAVREAVEAVTRLEKAERDGQAMRRRMRDFAESASDWFWEMDENLRYSWFSANVENTLGVSRSDFYGKTRDQVGAIQGTSIPWEEHLETLRRREPFRNFVYLSPRREGDRWIRATGTPIHDETGRFTGYRGTGSDVTREMEAETVLEKTRLLLENAVQSLAESFALWGPDDRLILCNDKFREMNGITSELVEPGTLFTDFIAALLKRGAFPDAAGRQHDWYEERLERYKNPRGPYEQIRLDGVWLMIDEQKLADGSTVTIGLDITKRKEAELALQESEALLISIFDNVPLGLLIKNENHVVERANGTYHRWYGLSPENIIGDYSSLIEQFQMESDGLFMREQERQVLTTGRVRTRQVERKFADGKSHIVEITKFPIQDRNGAIKKVGSISVDVTEQVRTQRKLLRSEAMFRDFAETASDWTWEMDRRLRLTAISDRYREIMGFDPSSHLGKMRGDLTSENTNEEKWHRHIDDLQNRRPFRNFRYEIIKPDGCVLSVSVSGKPVFDQNGLFDGYRGTGTNITEQRRLEEARDTALHEALDANEAKSAFLANMSHDLRTPLNAILGFSEIMREQILGPLGEDRYLEYAKDIHVSAAYLLDLVNDLLDISTIEAGERLLEKEEVCVGDLISDCVRTFVGKALSKDVELITDISTALPLLCADKRATRQILDNLLTNAIKFTPSGGKIVASAVAREKVMEIAIVDTGAGIAPERLDKIVNPFNRGQNSPYETDMGWGLGLSIVNSLVNLHDGQLEIESRPGEGTTVRVSLPNNENFEECSKSTQYRAVS